MFKLPPEFSMIISVFSPVFSKKIFERAEQLLLGCILMHGKRTVCGVLRTLGLQDCTNWDKYHRVLSRTVWSPLFCSKQLLKILIKKLINTDTLVFGIDETIERRWGPKIKARGIYRDAVRSSKSHFVKCSGLRWICVMLLTPIPWAKRVWALPFLTVLAPSQRYHDSQGKAHKTLSDWSRQICLLLYKWVDCQFIMLGDGSYAVMELLASTRSYMTWITRFRLDAALYDFVPEQVGKRRRGRPPIKGNRQASLQERLTDSKTKWQQTVFSQWYAQKDKQMEFTSGTAIWYRGGKPAVSIRWILIRDPDGILDPVAIQCTDLDMEPIQIVRHYLKRWCVEVTFEEVRAHIGVESQRQWSDLSILRSTPCLMALFSIITIWADQLESMQKLTVYQTAWYKKAYPTFSDAIASVRTRIWQYQISLQSIKNSDRKEITQVLINHLAFMAARAA